MRDFQLLVRLRVRHARTFLLRLAYLAGTRSVGGSRRERPGYTNSTSRGALLICAALLWFALLDVVEKTFVAVGSLLGIVAGFGAPCYGGLRCFVHWSVRAPAQRAFASFASRHRLCGFEPDFGALSRDGSRGRVAACRRRHWGPGRLSAGLRP